MERYSTLDIKAKVQADKDATTEKKEAEAKKITLSNDSFAICDFLEQLKRGIEHLRISSIRNR